MKSAFCTRCAAWRGNLGQEPTLGLHVEHIVEVFREVRRVLRKDGTLWLNYGDCYASAPSGSFANGQRGSGMEGGEFRSNKPFDTAVGGLKPKDLCMMPARVALALQADGWWIRSEIVWAKKNPMPESVTDRPTSSHEKIYLLTKAPRYFFDAEAVREPTLSLDPDHVSYRPNSVEIANTGRKEFSAKHKMSARNYNPAGRNIRNVWTIATQPFSQAHFATFPPALVEPCIKAGTSEKGCCPECGAPWVREVEKGPPAPEPQHRNPAKRLEPGQAGNIGAGNMGFRASRLSGQEMSEWKANHPDVTTGWNPSCDCRRWPAEPCTVLDPFGGAGTTGLVADRLKRDAILIELNPEYAAMARERIQADAGMFAEMAAP